jgi:hypothetical protein
MVRNPRLDRLAKVFTGGANGTNESSVAWLTDAELGRLIALYSELVTAARRHERAPESVQAEADRIEAQGRARRAAGRPPVRPPGPLEDHDYMRWMSDAELDRAIELLRDQRASLTCAREPSEQAQAELDRIEEAAKARRAAGHRPFMHGGR